MLQITGQYRKKKWSHWQTIADKLHINTITVLNQHVQIPRQICAKGGVIILDQLKANTKNKRTNNFYVKPIILDSE